MLNLDYFKKLETDVEGLNKTVKKLKDDYAATQVDTFFMGDNDCVLVAKEKSLDYKLLLLNPAKDTTLRPTTRANPKDVLKKGAIQNMVPEVLEEASAGTEGVSAELEKGWDGEGV